MNQLHEPFKYMLTATEILSTLDNCYENVYCHFITLNHPYVYLIDSRINIFRNNFGKWAIAAEVLGYNTRGYGYAIALEICYFGNCLTNFELFNNKPVNSYIVLPVDWDNFNKTIDCDVLKPGATSWIVRGSSISLSHNKQDYIDAGIELKEYKPHEISGEEAGRLAILKNRDLFRATNDELYKSIPNDLDKILVIDEWYHKEFYQSKSPFEEPEMLSRFDLSNEEVRNMIQQEKDKTNKFNSKEWNDNRPGSCETWQQIADVIASGNTSLYKPTLQPNSHWKNWPESGTM